MPALLVSNRTRPALSRRARIVAGYAALAAAFFVAGLVIAPAPEGVPQSRWPSDRSWLPRPLPIGEFSLDAVGGAGRFTRERLVGRWTLMYFGYTSCADVCRPALAVLAQVSAELAARRRGVRIERVFVTVDPARDTPARLRDYASSADPGMVAVYGSDREIAGLAHQAGILYMRQARDAQGDYLVDHPAAILLVDPQARLRAGFLPPHDAARIVEEIAEMEPAFGRQSTR